MEAAILEAIERGYTYRDAALCGGIEERTLRRWRSTGEKALRGKLFRFVSALSEAEARARARVAEGMYRGLTERMTVKRRHVRGVRNKETGELKEEIIEEWTDEVLPDGRLQLEFLHRRDPEHWARREPEVRGSEKAWEETRKILGM